MKLNKLKSGMVVQVRNGIHYLVIETPGYMRFIRESGYLEAKDFDENLLCNAGACRDSDFDIMNVWFPVLHDLSFKNDINHNNLIWHRNTEDEEKIKQIKQQIQQLQKELAELQD